jgi:hypothetical protein
MRRKPQPVRSVLRGGGPSDNADQHGREKVVQSIWGGAL